MRVLNALLAVLLVIGASVLGLGFALSNSELVQVRYYLGTQAMPLSVIVLGALVLGLILGWLAALPSIIKLKIERRYYRRQRS